MFDRAIYLKKEFCSSQDGSLQFLLYQCQIYIIAMLIVLVSFDTPQDFWGEKNPSDFHFHFQQLPSEHWRKDAKIESTSDYQVSKISYKKVRWRWFLIPNYFQRKEIQKFHWQLQKLQLILENVFFIMIRKLNSNTNLFISIVWFVYIISIAWFVYIHK